MTDLDEYQLVVEAQKKNSKAISALYKKYFPKIYRYILYFCLKSPHNNPQIAEDLAQETFIKAFSKISQFQLEASFETWLKAIAKNLVIDHLRSPKWKEEGHQELSEVEVGLSMSTSYNYLDKSIDVQQILSKLNPEHQSIIKMRFIEQLSTAEVATRLYGSDTEENRRKVSVNQYKALQWLRSFSESNE